MAWESLFFLGAYGRLGGFLFCTSCFVAPPLGSQGRYLEGIFSSGMVAVNVGVVFLPLLLAKSLMRNLILVLVG
jgi:hypothetical protein